MKPQDITLENELNLLLAVVTIVRKEAQSANKNTQRRAIEWLNAMRLPVEGPLRRPRINTKKGKQGRPKRIEQGQRVTP